MRAVKIVMRTATLAALRCAWYRVHQKSKQ